MLVTPSTIHFDDPKGFLVLDGVNGAGKSTLLGKLRDYISAKNQHVICTREPGGTVLGKVLRGLLLEGAPTESGVKEKISPWAETFLFAADRSEHITKLIQPNLEAGKIVISDRYFYSTIAFQGYGRGFDVKKMNQICELAIQGLHPDMLLLLDLDPKEGLLRTQDRGSNKDAFEEEDISFHTRLREGFLSLARETKAPVAILDAAETPDKVYEQALPFVDAWLLSMGIK